MKRIIFLILIAIFILAAITIIYKTFSNTEEEEERMTKYQQDKVNEYCSQIKEENVCRKSYPPYGYVPCSWVNEFKQCVGPILIEPPMY